MFSSVLGLYVVGSFLVFLVYCCRSWFPGGRGGGNADVSVAQFLFYVLVSLLVASESSPP